MKLFAVHSNIFTNPKDLSSEKDFLISRRSLLLILCTKTEQNSRRQLHVHFFLALFFPRPKIKIKKETIENNGDKSFSIFDGGKSN